MVEMKKVWSRPLTVVQNFEANEYVAACGASGTVYKFTCNAGGGVSGAVYVETNNEPGWQEPKYSQIFPWPQISGDTFRSFYSACGATHEAESDSGFLDGYYVVDGNATPVIIWTDNDTNTHCTTQLDKTKWETAKS